MSAYATTTFSSPVGGLTLLASDAGLRAILWPSDPPAGFPELDEAVEDDRHPVLVATRQQLTEYFAGERRTFDLPIDLQGTPFQVKAWQFLATIPYGETRSYGEQARALGDPNRARAVGAANGKNPVSIVLPCHRVIGANGALTGFGGGLPVKSALLDFEAAVVAADAPVPFPPVVESAPTRPPQSRLA
jgi:methylated-DNA-[protein]-cysteine S-methyltransferase